MCVVQGKYVNKCGIWKCTDIDNNDSNSQKSQSPAVKILRLILIKHLLVVPHVCRNDFFSIENYKWNNCLSLTLPHLYDLYKEWLSPACVWNILPKLLYCWGVSYLREHSVIELRGGLINSLLVSGYVCLKVGTMCWNLIFRKLHMKLTEIL